MVDPIDGTQPYVSGLSNWCVSLGFVRDGTIAFGMVYAPARGELFAGGIGFSATLTALVERHPGRLIREGITGFGHSPRVTPEEFLPMFGRFIERGGMFYCDGSGALTLCYVAAGQLLGYIERHIKAWDCLGALAAAYAAGLEFERLPGRRWPSQRQLARGGKRGDPRRAGGYPQGLTAGAVLRANGSRVASAASALTSSDEANPAGI